jgi:aminopeptidase N
MSLRVSSIALIAALSFSCAGDDDASQKTAADTTAAAAEGEAEAEAASDSRDAVDALYVDKFSYSNPSAIRARHISFDLNLNFDAKVMSGTARLDLDYPEPGARRLVLDTKELTINRVDAEVNGAWVEAPHKLGAADPALGSKLTIELPDGAAAVRIDYATSPSAEGLQWLDPVQTTGERLPYLFSQAQAINARTMAPLQDTPAVRITYDARITAPDGVMVVMGAEQDPDGVADGEFFFKMQQPVPPYLIAIAAGDIVFKPINETIGVYAEPEVIDAAVAEFADTPQMEDANVALYGPYLWGRFDMLVLPPSFPFGGMENPRLTFLTPTLIAGDKSLTNVVAHELAHSWSGNLVTNATWRDSWLNEGFTSYVENRVMEALYGEERAAMERALDLAGLRAGVAAQEEKRLTRLKLPADISHPDEAFSSIAYTKGAFFLKFLEERFGRAAFDPFLKAYFDAHAFETVITEDFLNYLNDNLREAYPDAATDAEIEEWVYGEGVPSTIEEPSSERFEEIDALADQVLVGDGGIDLVDANDWTTQEWLRFINAIPDSISIEKMAALDAAFDLSRAQNAEIAFAWYIKAIKANYEPAFPPLEEFLLSIGRGKFLYPLYGALKESPRADWGRDVYSRARAGYHPIAQRRVDAVFGDD